MSKQQQKKTGKATGTTVIKKTVKDRQHVVAAEVTIQPIPASKTKTKKEVKSTAPQTITVAKLDKKFEGARASSRCSSSCAATLRS